MRKKTPPHVDLVPLMDTIFLLLFFFLCAAIMQPNALSLNLSGRSSEKTESYHKITITAEKVTGLAEADARTPVIIEAAPEVPFGRVDEVLRILQEKGITKVSFR